MKTRLLPLCLGLLLSLPALAKPPAQLRSWVLGVDSPNQATRSNAIKGLSQLSKTQLVECIPTLIGWVRTEKNQAARFSMAKVLAETLGVGTLAQYEQCLPFLSDPDFRVRRALWTAYAFGALHPPLGPKLFDQLLELTHNPNVEIRYEALHWAAEASEEQENPPPGYRDKIVQIMQSRLDDPEPRIRRVAHETVIRFYDSAPEAARQMLVKDVRDSEEAIRLQALRALAGSHARCNDPEHLAPLMGPLLELRLNELAAETDLSEASLVIEAQQHLGPLPDATLKYLETHLGQFPDPGNLLMTLGDEGPRVLPVVGLIVDKLSPEEVASSGMWLSFTGVPAASVPKLVSALKAKVQGFDTARLLVALAQSPAGLESVPTCLSYLKSEDSELRLAAAYALSKLDPTGPGGKAAAVTLQACAWDTEERIHSMPYFLLAVKNLGAQIRLPADRLAKAGDSEAMVLLRWVVDRKAGFPKAPDFLEDLGRGGDFRLNFGNDGTRTELYCLVLDWVAAQGERAQMAAPGLKILAKDRNPQVREAAHKALQAIGSV